MNRAGPKPLPIHLSLAAAAAAQEAGGQNAEELLRVFFEGLKKYQDHTYVRNLPELPVVWQEGQARMYLAKGTKKGRPLLLVPSMVNKSSILDLMEDRSFLRWQAQQGRDIYLLDWGRPVDDEGQGSMDALIGQRLIPAAEFLQQETGGPVHALGYCMGGLFLAAAAHIKPEPFHSLTYLATPWDFHAGDRAMQRLVTMWSPSGLMLIDQHGYLPMNWIQSVFASLDPKMTIRKFSGFTDMEEVSAQRFVAVEDWLNDGVDLPAEMARSCIRDLYLENATVHQKWQVMDKTIDPVGWQKPALIVAAGGDRLVPPESSLALNILIKGSDVLQPKTGHIGLIAGGSSVENVWQPIADWVALHD